jgi:hypothetical protein
MIDPQILKDLKPAKEFFIGIDSDGCVFNSTRMNFTGAIAEAAARIAETRA